MKVIREGRKVTPWWVGKRLVCECGNTLIVRRAGK